MPRIPTWTDWIREPKTCERSMKFFQKTRIAAIKNLPKRIAEDSLIGHLRPFKDLKEKTGTP